MNEPIRTDKEDRYLTEKIKPTGSSPKSAPLISKRKLIVLILAMFIIVLLLSFAFVKPSKQDEMVTNNSQQNTNNQNTNIEHVETLTPPNISRDATLTVQSEPLDKERIEIPGEITDILSQKIEQINTQESVQNNITLNSQNTTAGRNINELTLGKTIDKNHYTIQINASSSLESMLGFVKLHQLSNYQIIETVRDNKPWFILIKGDFPTVEDAKEALKSLPADLQNNSPWIKAGSSINK